MNYTLKIFSKKEIKNQELPPFYDDGTVIFEGKFNPDMAIEILRLAYLLKEDYIKELETKQKGDKNADV